MPAPKRPDYPENVFGAKVHFAFDRRHVYFEIVEVGDTLFVTDRDGKAVCSWTSSQTPPKEG